MQPHGDMQPYGPEYVRMPGDASRRSCGTLPHACTTNVTYMQGLTIQLLLLLLLCSVRVAAEGARFKRVQLQVHAAAERTRGTRSASCESCDCARNCCCDLNMISQTARRRASRRLLALVAFEGTCRAAHRSRRSPDSLLCWKHCRARYALVVRETRATANARQEHVVCSLESLAASKTDQSKLLEHDAAVRFAQRRERKVRVLSSMSCCLSKPLVIECAHVELSSVNRLSASERVCEISQVLSSVCEWFIKSYARGCCGSQHSHSTS